METSAKSFQCFSEKTTTNHSISFENKNGKKTRLVVMREDVYICVWEHKNTFFTQFFGCQIIMLIVQRRFTNMFHTAFMTNCGTFRDIFFCAG